jgi:hypothetical protein
MASFGSSSLITSVNDSSPSGLPWSSTRENHRTRHDATHNRTTRHAQNIRALMDGQM